MKLYVLKIKGKAKIPDYVQLRDEDFILKAYFRLDRPEKVFIKLGLEDKQTAFYDKINTLSFGAILELETNDL